jgi:hypothetical protein
MYQFVNTKLKSDVEKILKNGWVPTKGKVSGNSIEFDDDFSSYLYYGNVDDRDSDLNELEKLINEK